MKQHRWYEVIVAWAKGEEIECKWIDGSQSTWGPWNEDDDGAGPIDWNTENYIFRIKRDGQIDMDNLAEALDMLTLMIESVKEKIK
jgi:hypothetical protein